MIKNLTDMNYNFKSLILLLVLISGVMIIGCKEKPNPQPTADELFTESLTGAKSSSSATWTISSVTLDGVSKIAEWPGFTLTLSSDASGNISYSTSNGVSGGPWPASGTFTKDVVNNQLVRNDTMEVGVTTGSTTLDLSFTFNSSIHESGVRIESLDGAYNFKFSK